MAALLATAAGGGTAVAFAALAGFGAAQVFLAGSGVAILVYVGDRLTTVRERRDP